MLLFLIVLGIIFSPTIIGGKVIFEHGVLSAHHPSFAFLKRAFDSGGSFLWSGDYLSGFPIYLTQAGFFHPFSILYKFFNSFDTYSWVVFLNFFLGLVITYILARNLKLSKTSSLAVAFAYVFCHWYLNVGQLNIFANLIPILPLFILSIIKIHQKKIIFVFIGAITLIIGWLSCDIQEILYMVIIAFLLALFLDIKEYDSKISFLRNFSTVKKFLILSVVSLIFISPWLVSVFRFADLTTRGDNPQLFKDGLDIIELARFFYPQFTFRYLSGRTPLFIGILPLFLGIAAFFLPLKTRIVKFFITVVAVVFLLSFEYSPFFWLFNQLPIFNLFRLYSKWWLLGDFALILLAGFTLDNLPKFREHIRFKKYIKFLKIFTVIILAIILIANIVIFFFRSQVIDSATRFFDKYLYAQTTQAPIEFYHQMIGDIFDETAQVVSVLRPQFLITLIFILISAIFLILYQKGKFVKNVKKIALAIIILNVVFVWKLDDNVRTVAPKETLVNPPPIAQFLKGQDSEFRIHRFIPHLRPVEYIEMGLNDLRTDTELSEKFDFESLRPNINVIYDIDSVEAHEHFITRRHLAILQILGSDHVDLTGVDYTLWDELSKDPSLTLKDRFTIFQSEKNRNILSMMNVRYVISPFEFPFPWKKVFETMVDSIPIYIYENPDVLPRIYFVDKVEFVEPDEKAAFDSLLKIRDFKEKTLIECSNCGPSLWSRPSFEDEIIIEENQNGYLKLKTKTKSPRWLVWSESNLPTWEVKINNELTKTYFANYIYQAVLVPRGESEIEFRYPGLFDQFSYSLKKLIGKEK